MSQYYEVVFYFIAHMDDWQLFMNPAAYHDMSSLNKKVVFIYTTANDSGADQSFWRANEEATLSSIRFGLPMSANGVDDRRVVRINNHNVHRWNLGNVVCYFLRLPDGNVNGSGFPIGNHQSLEKLRLGRISSITTLDQSSVYSDWAALVELLQKIVDLESISEASTTLHYPETSISLNPDDHSDHRMTGFAVQDIPKYNHYHRHAYLGYTLSAYAPDLKGDDLFWKCAQFIIYDKSMYDLTRYSLLKLAPATYMTFCQRAGQSRYFPPNLNS